MGQTNSIIYNARMHRINSKGLNLMMKEAEGTSDFDYSEVFVLDTGATFHSVMSESNAHKHWK